MNSKKQKNEKLTKGMTLVKGGIELSKVKGGRSCICSPGGWAYGNVDCGCACGCFGPSSPQANNSANLDIANPIV